MPQHDIMRRNSDEMAGDAFYAFYIKGDFVSSADGADIPAYEIEGDTQLTYADGSVKPELETCNWVRYCEGHGGY